MNRACAYRWGLRALLLAWMLAVGAESRATEIPVSIVSNDAIGYATEKEAALAALQAAADCSDRVELAGGIILTHGQYFYTLPIPGSHEHFIMRLRVAGKLTAIYHTHPGHLHADEVSLDDKQTAMRLQVTSYILAIATNQILIFNGDSHAR